jgi:hypothetical protein
VPIRAESALDTRRLGGTMTRMRARSSVGVACALVLSCGSPAWGRPDEGAEQRKQAERAKLQERFEKRASVVVESIAAATWNTVVAVLDARPFLDLPEWHADARALQSSLMQRYLRAGVLALPFERDRKVAAAYAYGKLPKGPLASDADLGVMRGKGASWLLVTRLVPNDEGSVARLELYDLRPGGRPKPTKLDLGPIPTKRFPMTEIVGPDFLPPRNRKILWFAVEHFGRGVGRGECWDLPAAPIQGDGGVVHGYAFGREVPWEQARAGDVITFGNDGGSGGHVVVLFRWAPDRGHATVLHQNWAGNRTVMLAGLGGIEGNKQGQRLRVWRP